MIIRYLGPWGSVLTTSVTKDAATTQALVNKISGMLFVRASVWDCGLFG